jgi:transcriptional regulator with GAF, ATPase, and Fis domain
MIIRDKVVGVMYHDNSLLASNFNETDLDILSFFAAQAAIAIDNAQAYGEITRLNRHLKEEKEYYKEKVLEHVHFEEIVGKSQSILEVLSNVKQVADTDATVLILGETGVGKELVARAVHAQSTRSGGPFIRVHCSALPESLISSELFGHEKGAFTGASQKRIGRFELADNGTLFLDEIGELPMEIQVHLLRVLQTGEFERVGGSRTLRSNFRLVLATNRNLEKEVQKKRFRQDLYYRINVFPILVPPLRDRKEDIPLLASYFSHLYGKRLNKPSCNIRQKDVDKLMDYDWPGNVRELENVIERAMILSKGSELIFPELQWQQPISTVEKEKGLPTLMENERQLIITALRQTSGKIQGKGGAAELLGINHNTLKSRMRKFGIARDQVMG